MTIILRWRILIVILQQAAKKGNLPAMHNLGRAYLQGQGVATNVDEAIHWFTMAAKGGVAESARALMMIYTSSKWGRTDYPKALEWGKKDSEGDDYVGQYYYGRMLYYGIGTEPDLPQGWYWVARSATNCLGLAQYIYGHAQLVGNEGLATNCAEGFSWMRLAALQDLPDALNELGYCYMNGVGTTQDFKEGIRLYQSAAGHGSVVAMSNLALEYTKGRALPSDPKLSYEWEKKAADAGYVNSQYVVGRDFLLSTNVVETNVSVALDWLNKAAQQEYPQAQALLGTLYSDGIIVTKDPELGREWLEKAKAKQHPETFIDSAIVKLAARQSPVEMQKAKLYLENAAQAGSSEGTYLYAEVLLGYHGLPTEMGQARKWLQKAAEFDYHDAQYNFAVMCLNGTGGERDPASAFLWLQKAVKSGHAMSMYELGMMYANGLGTDTNQVEAFKLFRAAAASNIAPAQYEAAKAYYHGLGVDKDYSEAINLCKLAAKANWPPAKTFIGEMFRSGGCGLPVDTDLAMKWYYSAANSGDVLAQNRLANLYRKGVDVPASAVDAEKWFGRGANQGDAYSENSYGYALENGYGTLANPVEAYKWFLLSAAQNNADAKANLEVLRSKLTQEQIEEAEKMANGFKPKSEALPLLIGLNFEKFFG